MTTNRSTDAAARTTNATDTNATGIARAALRRPGNATAGQEAISSGPAASHHRDQQGPACDTDRRLAQQLLAVGPEAVGCLVSSLPTERRGVSKEVCRRVRMRQENALELNLAELGRESTISLIGHVADACERAGERPTTVVLADLHHGDTDYCEAVSDLMARLRASGATIVTCVSPEDEQILEWVGRHVSYDSRDLRAGEQHGAVCPQQGDDMRYAMSRIPPYITTEQAAYLLSVSCDLIRKHVRNGIITETCHVGTLLRIRTRPFLDRFDIPLEEAYEIVRDHTAVGPKVL